MESHSPQYVDTAKKLEPLLQHLQQQPVVGLDTEFISEGRYEPALCLVQLSTPEGIWLVDPLGIDDLQPLWKILVAPGRELVTVAARQEIKFCVRGAGAAPSCLLDLQVAAGLLGFSYPLSHTNLVMRVTDTKIHGGESFTDWRKRPLAAVQMKYAADDVRYLLQMRNKLLQRAEKMGRTEWIRGECASLVSEVSKEEEKWLVSGSARLSRRQLGVLRELWRWRDREARRLNQPVARILGDSMLVEIAKRSPASVEDLFAIRGLDRRIIRNGEQEVMAAVERGAKLSESELPTYERRDDPPQVGVITKLLSVAVNGLAAEFDVDTALLATTADLQDLVRWFLQKMEGEEPPVLHGWRGEIVREPLLGFLEGKRCVRVANVKRANPLVFEDCGRD
jgi:ribonuclease D